MRGGEVGQILGGRYRIAGELGEGGMGRVFLAVHVDLDDRVAIKLLSDGSERSRARFLREARAVARLKSEHIARVLDLGSEDEPYIVMEFVDGVDLASLVETEPLPVARAIDYALQACAGLAEAHRIGIVHRDVKPSNLRVTKRADGTDLVKVLDFGIAKAEVTGATTLTQTSDVLGSPRYMSPEQIREAHSVDARSDIWSLGVVLYQLVTARLPFEAFTTAGMLARISADPPASPREHRADLPEALEAVLLRCLEKKPAERYADVEAFARALAPFGNEDAAAMAERVARILHTKPEPRIVVPAAWKTSLASAPNVAAATGPTGPSSAPEASGRMSAQPVVATTRTVQPSRETDGAARWRLVATIALGITLALVVALAWAGTRDDAPKSAANVVSPTLSSVPVPVPVPVPAPAPAPVPVPSPSSPTTITISAPSAPSATGSASAPLIAAPPPRVSVRGAPSTAPGASSERAIPKPPPATGAVDPFDLGPRK